MEQNAAPELPASPLELSSDAQQPGRLPDWSELMSDALRALTRAEKELTLVHMDAQARHRAVGHLIVARAVIIQIEEWCHA